MTPKVTSFLVNATTPTILAIGKSSRQYLAIQNESGILYVKLGNNVSLIDYSYRLTPNTLFECPVQHDADVTAIKEIGTSRVLVTVIE